MIRLIDRFTINCFSCETSTTISLEDIIEHGLHEYECPVCKENLSGNVHNAVGAIHSFNQEAEKINELLKEGDIISIP